MWFKCVTFLFLFFPQSDMGMMYSELSVIGRLRKISKCGPFSMFCKLIHLWRDVLSPTQVSWLLTWLVCTLHNTKDLKALYYSKFALSNFSLICINQRAGCKKDEFPMLNFNKTWSLTENFAENEASASVWWISESADVRGVIRTDNKNKPQIKYDILDI